jgi:hypothetical protein
MLPTKFRFIWPSGFVGEDFLKSANQKQELPVAAMFVNGSGWNEQSLYRGPSIDASYQVSLLWPSGFGEDLKKSANQKQEWPVAAMFVNRSGQN